MWKKYKDKTFGFKILNNDFYKTMGVQNKIGADIAYMLDAESGKNHYFSSDEECLLTLLADPIGGISSTLYDFRCRFFTVSSKGSRMREDEETWIIVKEPNKLDYKKEIHSNDQPGHWVNVFKQICNELKITEFNIEHREFEGFIYEEWLG